MPEKSTIENEFLHYTGKAGDVGRQLALGAIAIIWLFAAPIPARVAGGPWFTLPKSFRLPLFLVTGSLAIDALQYIVGCGMLYYVWCQNRGGEYVERFPKRAAILVVMIFLKLGLMVLAYALLLPAVLRLLG